MKSIKNKGLGIGMGLAVILAVCLAAGVNGVFNSVNSSLGYQVNGGAGSSGQVLCSDGTRFATPCTAAGTGISALTGPVTASGTGSVASTITATGVTAGSYTLANITVNAAGQLTAAANGGPAFTGTSGYQTLPSGLILQWGTSNPPTANSPFSQSLPHTFPTACLIAIGSDNGARVSGVGGSSGNPSPSGVACEDAATIWVNSESSNNGGSGAEPVGYLAIGY